MDKREVLLRVGGAVLAFSGLALVLVSGKIVAFAGIGLSDRAADFVLRAGFGTFLIGILMLFLFSFRTVPKELVDPLLSGQNRNLGRVLGSLELKGNGIYIPAGGRLKDERVYIPAEERPLPLPKLVSEQVLIVGTTGSSMGVSMLPPGTGLVDRIEQDSGKRFTEENLADLNEALERLSKGTGLIGSISARTKGDDISIEIKHSRFKDICEEAWNEDERMHSMIGCPGCSAVLCAAARTSRSPLRIASVEHKDGKVAYRLERW
ncbi:MAG: hypothetical protein ACMUHU_00200 [Thermoplasmatota archaeon]